MSDRLRLALSRDNHPEMPRYSGADLGMDMDKFAYFGLSIVWRGTAHDWTMLDGTLSPRFKIGGFEPPIREYLLGGAMPPDTAVIVIVASDDGARNVWMVPSPEDVSDEVPCISFRFLVRGVFFRVMMGRHLPQVHQEASCTTWRKCLWYGSMKRRMPEIMAIFDEKRGLGNDQADSTSQALDWVRQGYWGPGMGIFNYYRIAHEKMMKEQGARYRS